MRPTEARDTVTHEDRRRTEYREDQSPRCSRCGNRIARDVLGFDQDGKVLCPSCAARGVVRAIEHEQVREGHYRVCPSCKEPTMLPHDPQSSSPFRGDAYRCAKCGRVVTFSSPGSIVATASVLFLAAGWGTLLVPNEVLVQAALAVPLVLQVGYETYKRLRFPRSRRKNLEADSKANRVE
jgi:DNA-directed RNA polymerase subunit RPC12/RpoP